MSVNYRDLYERAADRAGREYWEPVEEAALRAEFGAAGFGQLLAWDGGMPELASVEGWSFVDVSADGEDRPRDPVARGVDREREAAEEQQAGEVVRLLEPRVGVVRGRERTVESVAADVSEVARRLAVPVRVGESEEGHLPFVHTDDTEDGAGVRALSQSVVVVDRGVVGHLHSQGWPPVLSGQSGYQWDSSSSTSSSPSSTERSLNSALVLRSWSPSGQNG
jgi:hypothetical protein